MFSNKSKALVHLQEKKKLIFNIPEFIIIKIIDWKKNKKIILQTIKKKFKNDLLIIRSSASDEDKKLNTSAGKYESIANVRASNANKLEKSVNRVKMSISKRRKLNSADQIIIQKMIKNVSMSGVVFTKLIENGSNYYSINYDDISGKTNLVTSGSSENSNKMLYIRRDHIYSLRSKRFLSLIKAVKNLEKNFGSDELDIEFAVDKNLKPFLFQVRPLIFRKKSQENLKNKVDKILLRTSNKIYDKLNKKNLRFGKKGLFGNMPDWNPAEIIGQHPSDLSKSLFSILITNDIWSKAREEIGYQSLSQKKLVHYFAGQPYVDVRLSFNSFLLEETSSKVKEKLINHWLGLLKLYPENHDKVEFSISLNCFTFDDYKKFKYKLPKNITKKERRALLKSLKRTTLNFIENTDIINKQIKKIEQLDKEVLRKPKTDNLISKIKYKIQLCKNLGTLPFSILARFAFISQSMIDSLINKEIITHYERDNFLRNIKTVTSSFLEDLENFKKGKIKKTFFYKKYGHLRPGTYDILSKNYKDLKLLSKIDRKKIAKKKHENFYLSKKSKLNFKKVLIKNGIYNLSPEDFFNFFYKSIKFREKAKFIYSKYINQILILLSKYGRIYKLSKKELSFLDLNKIFSIEKRFSSSMKKRLEFKKLIKKNKIHDEINKRIKLPQLIFDKSAAHIIPHITSTPNFITSKKITSNIQEISSRNFNIKISQKIVLIENADPGFDWIFEKGINGLITKYGGANSHMAIRCSELNLPAAIGIGEKKYLELTNNENRSIELNCLLKKIDVIKW
ncbi:MAG: hypothetical protein CMI71_01225 [Candidatus Pelagibacter sp.]|nr:hypothetical protein [Candidatus Pelagibacter sp.]